MEKTDDWTKRSTKVISLLIDWLIVWCLTPPLAIFQLYCGVNKLIYSTTRLRNKTYEYKTIGISLLSPIDCLESSCMVSRQKTYPSTPIRNYMRLRFYHVITSISWNITKIHCLWDKTSYKKEIIRTWATLHTGWNFYFLLLYN